MVCEEHSDTTDEPAAEQPLVISDNDTDTMRRVLSLLTELPV